LKFPEPHHAHVDAPVHSPDQWLFKEGREPRHAVALYFAFYSFCRVHQTLRVTPAMEAGLTDHVWSVEELVALLPEMEAKKRGPYKKRAEA
jgi:hypothetical protein